MITSFLAIDISQVEKKRNVVIISLVALDTKNEVNRNRAKTNGCQELSVQWGWKLKFGVCMPAVSNAPA